MVNRKLKLLLIAVAILATNLSLYGQKRGFVSTKDAVYQQGRIIYDYANPASVKLIVTEQDQRSYNPQDLNFFGFRKFLGFGDSTVYESASIQLNQTTTPIFLKRHTSGKYHFLELETGVQRFFYTYNNLTTELTESNYKDELTKLSSGRPFWVFRINEVRFNRKHLIQFFRVLNRSNGQINLPQLSISGGTMSGDFELTKTAITPNHFASEKVSYSDVTFGITYQIPLAKKERLKLTTQLSYDRFNAIGSLQVNQDLHQDLNAKFNRVLFDITPEYKVLFGRVCPSIFWGPSLGVNLGKSSELFQTTVINQGQINFISIPEALDLDQIQFGMVFGVGLDFYVAPNIGLRFEYRRNSLRNGDGSLAQLNSNKLSLKIRIR